jgi:hypothetical protein
MLQGRNGCTQRLKVVFLHFYLRFDAEQET